MGSCIQTAAPSGIAGSPGATSSARFAGSRPVQRLGTSFTDRYPAEFSYRFNRRFELKAILPRLLAAAVVTRAMPQSLLKLAA
jgi:hypothetical protein